jgi:metal-responsive CopG/Arc/MetJ family transcriptional regulator
VCPIQETITLTLPEEIRSALDDLTHKEGLSPSEEIREAIKEYLFYHRLRLLRERMILKATERGIKTDQDVFDRVS